MRKLLFCLVAVLFVSGAAMAQDANKAFKTAKKAFTKYTYDRSANAGSLADAISSIETAFGSEDIKGQVAAQLLRANIYNEVMSDPTDIYRLKYPNAVDFAYEGFQNVLSMDGAKKFEVTAAKKAMENIANGFSMKGANMFQGGKYAAAAAAFKKVLEVKESLGLADDSTEEFQGDLYNTGLAAMNAEDKPLIIETMGRLLKAGYKKPNVYEGLYRAHLEDDETKALEYLEAGRTEHPENNSLLTSEINYYLKAGKLEVLEDKLLQAIENDPENKVLHMVTGSMYEKLFQNAYEAKDASADGHFAKAEQYYNSAIKLDEKYFDAIYSLGALYFNKTTPMRKEMNELPYSEQARFDALKSEVTDLMDKALPYFETADKLNAQDYSTIFALKEIYARKDDLTKSNEYKARLEKLKN